MIVEMKTYFKLMKYGYALKSNIVTSILMVLIGTFYILNAGDVAPLGYMFIAEVSAYNINTITSNLDSGMVAASPMRRNIETRAQDMLQIIGAIIAAVFVLLITYVGIEYFHIDKQMELSYEWILVVGGFMMGGILFASTVLQKHLFAGIVLLVGTMALSLLMVTTSVGEFLGIGNRMEVVFVGHVGLSIVLFLVGVAVGVVLSMIYRRVFYKKFRPRRVNDKI